MFALYNTDSKRQDKFQYAVAFSEGEVGRNSVPAFFVWFMYTGIATSRLPCSFWPLLCNISLKYANKVSGSSGTSHSQVQWWYEKPLRCGAFFNSSLLQVDSTFYFDICAPFVVL